MLPAYRDGDTVLVDTGAYEELLPLPGDVVLVEHPFQAGVRMIKRVDHMTKEGRVFVVGDNRAASTDSHSFGALRSAQVLGKLIGNTA